MDNFYYIIIIIVIFFLLKSSCKKVENFANDCDTIYENDDENKCYYYDYNSVHGCKVIVNKLKWNEGGDYDPDKWCEECGKLDKQKKKNNCNCSPFHKEYVEKECEDYEYTSVKMCKEDADDQSWCEKCNDIISKGTNCLQKTSNNLFREIIKNTKKSDTFMKLTFSISKAYADKIKINSWPIKMYFENETYYIGDKGVKDGSYFFTFDDKNDNLKYNYQSHFRHKFLQTIYLDFENTTFCKKKCKLEIHLFDYLIFNPNLNANIGQIARTMFVKNIDRKGPSPPSPASAGTPQAAAQRPTQEFSDLDLHRIVEIYRDKYLSKDGIRHEMYDYKNKIQIEGVIYIPLKFGNKYFPLCNQYTGNYKMWGGTLIANDIAKKEKKKCLYETGCTYNHKECCPKYCKLKKNGKISGKIDCRNCWLYYKNKEFVDNNGGGEQKNITWIDHHQTNLIFSKSLVDAVLLEDVNLVKRLIKEGANVNRIMHNRVALLEAINHVNIPIIKEILKVKNVFFDFPSYVLGYNDALKFTLQRLKEYRNSSFMVQKKTAKQLGKIALTMIDKGATIIHDHLIMDIDFFIEYKGKLKDKLKDIDSEFLFSKKAVYHLINHIKSWRNDLNRLDITDNAHDATRGGFLKNFPGSTFDTYMTGIIDINTDWIKKVNQFTNNKKLDLYIPIIKDIKDNIKNFKKVVIDNKFKGFNKKSKVTYKNNHIGFFIKKYNELMSVTRTSIVK